MIHEQLTYKIRGAIFEAFRHFGLGLFESVYEKVLLAEFRSIGLKVTAPITCGGLLQR